MLKKSEFMTKEFVYDFAKDAGAIGTITMTAVDPTGSLFDEGVIIKKAMIYVETAVTSGGTPTVTFGPAADTDGYFVDVFALVGSANAVVMSGQVDGALLWDSAADAGKGYYVTSVANTQNVQMVIGTATLLTGKIRVIFECYKPGTISRA